MRRSVIGIAFLLCDVFASAAGGSSCSLDIDLAPTAQAGKVVAAPNIALLADSPAAITITDGDLAAEFRVSVDSKASRAIAQLKVSRAGKVVAFQKTSVAIR